MKLIFFTISSKNIEYIKEHVLIFNCGIVKISDINRFAKFSTRAPDPDKKNFASNLMDLFQKKISIFSKDLHRWHL